MKTLKLITSIVLMAVMYSCHKDHSDVLTDGTYSGQATQYTALAGGAVSTNVVLKITSPSYDTYLSIQSNAPYAQGSYKISGSQVTFTNTILYNVNTKSGPILNGTYSFKVKADSLTLTQFTNGYPVIYSLKRQ
ncbi:hypothetical protein HDF18_09305 [Mucilaginibacter sp. X5P1]|uniref:hypothetical protein n=1 Tax=Mucilaginibacter sp. X5P1 TaxID=2723088 RepID=UPI00161CAE97|nr:hypothetical protein [Mucilaginibacter sp. X5P1]MBB6137860.1 hypothetical protein [Mucilaginibacter sp. X5P1]